MSFGLNTFKRFTSLQKLLQSPLCVSGLPLCHSRPESDAVNRNVIFTFLGPLPACCVLATQALWQVRRKAGNFTARTPFHKPCRLFPSLPWMALEFPGPCNSCGFFLPLLSLCLHLGLLGSSVPPPTRSSKRQVCEGRQCAACEWTLCFR